MLDGRWRATVERGLEPVGQGLHRAGITADGLTVIGLVFAVGTALLIADGHLLLGVFGVVLTGLPDILDGSVARQSGRAGPRGAFFDSVCDRVADAALFIGVAWYLSETEDARYAVLAMAVLALSMLITYERARAESLGFQRAWRAHGARRAPRAARRRASRSTSSCRSSGSCWCSPRSPRCSGS